MDFGFTEEQEAIRDSVARICADFDDAYWLQRDREGGQPKRAHKVGALGHLALLARLVQPVLGGLLGLVLVAFSHHGAPRTAGN